MSQIRMLQGADCTWLSAAPVGPLPSLYPPNRQARCSRSDEASLASRRVSTGSSAIPHLQVSRMLVQCLPHIWNSAPPRALRTKAVNSTYFGLLAEFGEANIPLDRVAPKYFGLICAEARRRAPAKQLPCRAFRLGGQKSPWLVSATDLAELIDVRRQKAGGDLRGRAGRAPVFAGVMSRRFSGFRFV